MLNKLRKKIESVIYDTEESATDMTTAFLSGVSRCYGKVMGVRETLYAKRIKKSYGLPCYVISVGNLTVGGTGKTPMVIYLAGVIKRLGYNPAVVSRGYGGTASAAGGVVSDGERLLMDAGMAGDEPFMMAKRLIDNAVPVIIGSDRYSAGMTAVNTFKPDVIILDDGFQHLRLKRDLDILLFDAKNPLGNGNILPRGTLREPACAMERADLFVLTRVEKNQAPSARDTFYDDVADVFQRENIGEIPLFTSTHRPHIHGIVPPRSKERVSGDVPDDGRDVFAFSGIAKNHEFRKTAESMGFNIKGYLEFPDHYFYSEDDCSAIATAAVKSGAGAIITTEKDYVKIAGFVDLAFELIIIGVEIDFDTDEKLFGEFIKTKIKNREVQYENSISC